MTRPCFLVVDPEFAGGISTRKLVIETAKLNVISVYSSREAIETLGRFPAVDGVVMNDNIPDMACAELMEELKRVKPGLPIVVVGGEGTTGCPGADHYIESFDPKQVLKILQRLQPEKTAAIEARVSELGQQP
jgi:CheY-like chemotaxis protein